jgi:Lon protease-like protein
MTKSIGVGVLVLPVVVGCSNQSSVAARTAASDFGCQPEGLRVQELRDDRYKADGCGRSRTYECVDGSCWHEGRLAPNARERAAREFGCAAGRVEVRWIQDDTYRVEACGQAATYACDDDDCAPEGATSGPTVVAIPLVVK